MLEIDCNVGNVEELLNLSFAKSRPTERVRTANSLVYEVDLLRIRI